MTDAVPAAAITAATLALHERGKGNCACQSAEEHEHWLAEDEAAAKAALEAAAPYVTTTNAAIDEAVSHAAAAERDRIRGELAGDQAADHAPVESGYGLTCRTCVAWQDDEGATEFGIAIPEPWPCRVARILDTP